MNKRIFLLLFVLFTYTFAEFKLTDVVVDIHNIQIDGSASVKESIEFLVIGEQSWTLYNSLFSIDDLSAWIKSTGMDELRIHVNRGIVNVEDFRLLPQPLRYCNPMTGVCRGKIILDYKIKTKEEENKSGSIFYVEKYKPRTYRFRLNPKALSFKESEDGNIILGENIFLKIHVPKNSKIIDVNPMPQNENWESEKIFTWSNGILVNFSFVFDVEQSLYEEIFEFFSSLPKKMEEMFLGENGWAWSFFVLVLLLGYIMLKAKKR